MAGSDLIDDSPGDELSSNRTAMAFARTELAADRTLMASVRTALSLISFGFTIHSVMKSLKSSAGDLIEASSTRFPLTLIALGILVLVFGLTKHWQDLRHLRKRGQHLHDLHLLHDLPRYGITGSTFVAIVLLVIGLLAVARIAFRFGPF